MKVRHYLRLVAMFLIMFLISYVKTWIDLFKFALWILQISGKLIWFGIITGIRLTRKYPIGALFVVIFTVIFSFIGHELIYSSDIKDFLPPFARIFTICGVGFASFIGSVNIYTTFFIRRPTE